MKFINKLPITALLTGLGLLIWLTTLLLNVEVFEHIIEFLNKREHFEADEIIVLFILIAIGLAADLRRQRHSTRHQNQLQAQRLKTMRATIRTVEDVVGNNLYALRMMCEQANREPLTNENQTEAVQLINESLLTLRKIKAMEDTPEIHSDMGSTYIDITSAQKEILR